MLTNVKVVVVAFILISLFSLLMPLAQGQQTILVANSVNRGQPNIRSRVYLYNPSASAGQVTVRVFTLPLIGGIAQELTTAPLSLGTLGARSARELNTASLPFIKLATKTVGLPLVESLFLTRLTAVT